MTITTKLGQNLSRTVTVVVVLALVVAAGLWWVLRDGTDRRVSAVFSGVIGLYEGNDVRVLGVKVGHVDTVEPQGKQVKVDMLVDRDVVLPLDAKAVIVAPSLVSDRYVQFTPVYRGGPELADGTVIGMDRTATPLEVDELAASLNRLSNDLGPNGVNKNGALSDLLNTAARNADGNGQALNDTITQLSQLSGTLSANSTELFGTVDNLQKFTTALATSDAQVRSFSDQVTSATQFLAAERGTLAAAVRQLSETLPMVQQFINDNRGRVKSNVDKLAAITQVVVQERAALAETLDVTPVGLSNIINSYNGGSGALDARANINELSYPLPVLVCNLLKQGTPAQLPPTLGEACASISDVVTGLVPLPSPQQVLESIKAGKVPNLPLPLAGMLFTNQEQGGTR